MAEPGHASSYNFLGVVSAHHHGAPCGRKSALPVRMPLKRLQSPSIRVSEARRGVAAIAFVGGLGGMDRE
jgi:hypothetical protein